MLQVALSSHFASREAWRQWLLKNHTAETEIWIIYYKKQSGKLSIVYREALEEALCFGWIDGMIKRIDEEQYMQRFTPRRIKSNWSETNIRLARKLTSEGRMHESGLAFRSRWESFSGELPRRKVYTITPTEIEEALKAYPVACSNFHALTPSCKNQYVLWIMDAKREETRARRIAEAVAMLQEGKKLGMK